MKKAFIVFSLIVMILAGNMIQVKRSAHAIVPLGAAVAGAGAVAAGPYIIAGLLIAGGAAVVVGMDDEDIRQKAIDIYNRTSDGFKQTLTDSIAAGNKTIALTSDMKTEITNAAVGSGQYIGYLLSRLEWRNLNDTGYYYQFYNNGNRVLNLNVSAINNGYIYAVSKLIDGDTRSLEAVYYGSELRFQTSVYNAAKQIYEYHVFGRYTYANNPDVIAAYNNAKSVATTIEMFQKVGVDTSMIKAVSAVAASDVFDGNFESALQGLNEVDIPLDTWLNQAQTNTGQKVNVDTTTGTMTLEDGTPYEGEVAFPWTIPKGETGSFPDATISNPAVPTDQVFPKTETAVETPTTGDTAGILTGLWDWLKGILQQILDAIKAVAAAVVAGLTSLLQGIIDAINAVKDFLATMAAAIADAIGAIFLPGEGYFTEFFKAIKAKWDTKLPIIGRLAAFLAAVRDVAVSQNPPEFMITLTDSLGGGTYNWLDLDFFDDYKTLIVNFIRFVAWFVFLKRLYARIPRMIGE